MDAYVLATEYSLEGDEESESLFLYHNKIIKDFIEESYKIIRQETKEQLIDSFIKQTENINILIYRMNRIFTFLDCFYNLAKNKGSLSKNAINLYKTYFFDPLQDEIYKEVNKLIKEDRNCNIESRPKIKIISKILYDLDLSFPKIKKDENKIFWISKKETENKNVETKYQDKW